jgi:hypothetical protein
VSYDIIHQCNLASAEFEKGIDEFEKSGLNKTPSVFVNPPRLAESKAQLECKLLQIIETGSGGGAGNLVICRILALHINESVLSEDGSVSPYRFDQVARMGKNYWARMIPEAIIEMPRMPDAAKVLGFDRLPDFIKTSPYLSGNEIALLANNERLPTGEELSDHIVLNQLSKEEIAKLCKEKISQGKWFEALCIAMFLR